jgi:hypothetical protein
MKKKLIITILLTYCCLSPLVASFKFIIAPPIVNLKLRPGSSNKVDLRIYNKDSKELVLSIDKSAFNMDVDGNSSTTGELANEFSCTTWLQIAQKEITIPPDSNISIHVTVHVPNGVYGGRYGIVLFQTTHPIMQKNEVALTGRMGSIFMIEIVGPKKIEGIIDDFKIIKEDSLVKFITHIKNTGNIHVKAKGSVLIKNDIGKIIDRINLLVGTGTILPNHRRVFTASWTNQRKIQQGNYSALLQVQIPGMGRILQIQKDFTIN